MAATVRPSKDAVLLDKIDELSARCRCAALPARAGRDAARRGEIENCKLKIANCKLIGLLKSICNFQATIFNLQFVLLVFLFSASAAAEVQLPEGNTAKPIRVSAQAANRWQLGAYDVWVLRGGCTIQQGAAVATCREAVLWIDRAEATENRPNKVIAYLEGDVKMASGGQPDAARLTDQTWFGRFYSVAAVEVRAATTAGRPDCAAADLLARHGAAQARAGTTPAASSVHGAIRQRESSKCSSATCSSAALG